MIVAKSVGLTYPDGSIGLKPFDLQVSPGQLMYITGPSGSGKTSLLKLLMGIEYPTTGELCVLGQAIRSGQTPRIVKTRRQFGPIFQEFRLIKGRSSMENVLLGMRFLNLTPNQMKENAQDALKRVGLEHKIHSMVENLSWGETQRVAIARAVARKPALILADEPTGNLDKDNALNILELLSSFRDEKTAVLITTHATHLIHGGTNVTWMQMEAGNIQLERLG